MSEQLPHSQNHTPIRSRDSKPPALVTNFSNNKSPFNYFVTNELSALSPVFLRNHSSDQQKTAKKFSFSSEIVDFLIQPERLSKKVENRGLEQFLGDDSSCSPLLYSKRSFSNGNSNMNNGEENTPEFVEDERKCESKMVESQLPITKNIIETMMNNGITNPPLSSQKKQSHQTSDSEISYRTPTFFQGNVTPNTTEFSSYRSPKFLTPIKENNNTNQNNKNENTPTSFMISEDDFTLNPNSNNKTSIVSSVVINNNAENILIGCNCKKSKCLKLYCECFRVNKFCIPSCNCTECKNNNENKERTKAINSIINKNPFAFGQKNANNGCNCKKSNCRKKYCECFGVGLKCSELCKCENCKNKKSAKNEESRKNRKIEDGGGEEEEEKKKKRKK